MSSRGRAGRRFSAVPLAELAKFQTQASHGGVNIAQLLGSVVLPDAAQRDQTIDMQGLRSPDPDEDHTPLKRDHRGMKSRKHQRRAGRRHSVDGVPTAGPDGVSGKRVSSRQMMRNMLMASVFVQGPLAQGSSAKDSMPEGSGDSVHSDEVSAFAGDHGASTPPHTSSGERAKLASQLKSGALSTPQTPQQSPRGSSDPETAQPAAASPSLAYTASLDDAMAKDREQRTVGARSRVIELHKQRKAAMRRAAADGYTKGVDSFAYGGPPERPGTGYVDVRQLKQHLGAADSVRRGAGAAVAAGATAAGAAAGRSGGQAQGRAVRGNVALAPQDTKGHLSYGARLRAARRLRRFSVGPGQMQKMYQIQKDVLMEIAESGIVAEVPVERSGALAQACVPYELASAATGSPIHLPTKMGGRRSSVAGAPAKKGQDGAIPSTVSAYVVPYALQGNLQHYTIQGMLQRQEAKQHPVLRRVLRRIWDAVKSQVGQHQVCVTHAGYVDAMTKLYIGLVPDAGIDSPAVRAAGADCPAEIRARAAVEEARAVAELDWARDTYSGESKPPLSYMNRAQISNCIMELADQWTQTASAREYIQFALFCLHYLSADLESPPPGTHWSTLEHSWLPEADGSVGFDHRPGSGDSRPGSREDASRTSRVVEINGRKVVVSVEAGEVVGLRLRRVDPAAAATALRDRGEMQVSPRAEIAMRVAMGDSGPGLSGSSSTHTFELGPRLRPSGSSTAFAPGIWEEEAPGVFTNRALMEATTEAESRATARRIATSRRRQSLTAGVMALWTRRNNRTPATRKARWDKLIGSSPRASQGTAAPDSVKVGPRVLSSFRLGSSSRISTEHDSTGREVAASTASASHSSQLTSRRNSMPTLSSVEKVRKALQSQRFKAMVQSMRKSNAAKDAQAELQAAQNGNLPGSATRRHSLFAMGAGVVDADRKKQLRAKAMRAAAKTNQALALRLLEGKTLDIGSGLLRSQGGLQSPKRPFASPKSTPRGKFADAFSEAAKLEAAKERRTAKQVVLFGVGDGLLPRTWELQGVFPIRLVKHEASGVPQPASGTKPKSKSLKSAPVGVVPTRPYPSSLDALDEWEVAELFDMRYGARKPDTDDWFARDMRGSSGDGGPDGRAASPTTRLAYDLAVRGGSNRTHSRSRRRYSSSARYGSELEGEGSDVNQPEAFSPLPTSTSLRRRRIRANRKLEGDAVSVDSSTPQVDVPMEEDVQRAEGVERADPAGPKRSGKTRGSRRSSATATPRRGTGEGRSSSGDAGVAGAQALPFTVPGAALDATIASTAAEPSVDVIEYRSPAISRAGVYKRVYVGPAARGWRWRAVVAMPSGVEAVIGDFDDQASAAVAHDVAVRRLYPSRPANATGFNEPSTNFDLAGHLVKPQDDVLMPRVFWPAASRNAALVAKRRVDVTQARGVDRSAQFTSCPGDSGEEDSSDQSDFDSDTDSSSVTSEANNHFGIKGATSAAAAAKRSGQKVRFDVDKFLQSGLVDMQSSSFKQAMARVSGNLGGLTSFGSSASIQSSHSKDGSATSDAASRQQMPPPSPSSRASPRLSPARQPSFSSVSSLQSGGPADAETDFVAPQLDRISLGSRRSAHEVPASTPHSGLSAAHGSLSDAIGVDSPSYDGSIDASLVPGTHVSATGISRAGAGMGDSIPSAHSFSRLSRHPSRGLSASGLKQTKSGSPGKRMKPSVDMMLRQPMPSPQAVHGSKSSGTRGQKEWAALKYQQRVQQMGPTDTRGVGPGITGASEVEEDIRLRRIALGDDAADAAQLQTESSRPSAAALVRKQAPLAHRSSRREQPKLLKQLPGWVEADLVSLQAGKALLRQIKDAAGPAKVLYAGSSKGPKQNRRPQSSAAASEYTTDDEDIVLEARVPRELLEKAGVVGRLRNERGKRRGNLVAQGDASPNSRHIRKAARAGRKRGSKNDLSNRRRASKLKPPAGPVGEVIFDSQGGPTGLRHPKPPSAGSAGKKSGPSSRHGSRASRRMRSRVIGRPGTRGTTASSANSSQLGKDLWGRGGGSDGLDGAMGAIAAAARELHGVFDPDDDGGALDELIGPVAGAGGHAASIFDEEGDTTSSSAHSSDEDRESVAGAEELLSPTPAPDAAGAVGPSPGDVSGLTGIRTSTPLSGRVSRSSVQSRGRSRATPAARFGRGTPDGAKKPRSASRPSSRPGRTPPEVYKDREYRKKQAETKAAIQRMRAQSLVRKVNAAKRAVRVLAKLTATAARRSSTVSMAGSEASSVGWTRAESVGIPTPRAAAASSGVGAMFISADTQGPDTDFAKAGHSLRVTHGARGRRPSVDMLTKAQEMALVQPQQMASPPGAQAAPAQANVPFGKGEGSSTGSKSQGRSSRESASRVQGTNADGSISGIAAPDSAHSVASGSILAGGEVGSSEAHEATVAGDSGQAPASKLSATQPDPIDVNPAEELDARRQRRNDRRAAAAMAAELTHLGRRLSQSEAQLHGVIAASDGDSGGVRDVNDVLSHLSEIKKHVTGDAKSGSPGLLGDTASALKRAADSTSVRRAAAGRRAGQKAAGRRRSGTRRSSASKGSRRGRRRRSSVLGGGIPDGSTVSSVGSDTDAPPIKPVGRVDKPVTYTAESYQEPDGMTNIGGGSNGEAGQSGRTAGDSSNPVPHEAKNDADTGPPDGRHSSSRGDHVVRLSSPVAILPSSASSAHRSERQAKSAARRMRIAAQRQQETTGLVVRAAVPRHLQGTVGGSQPGVSHPGIQTDDDVGSQSGSDMEVAQPYTLDMEQLTPLIAAPTGGVGIVGSRSGRVPRSRGRVAVTQLLPDGLDALAGSGVPARDLGPRAAGSTQLRRITSMSPRLTGLAGDSVHSAVHRQTGRAGLARASSHREIAALRGAAPPMLRSIQSRTNGRGNSPSFRRGGPIVRLETNPERQPSKRQPSGGSISIASGLGSVTTPTSRHPDQPERVAVIDIHAMIGAIDDLIAEQTAMTQYRREVATQLVEKRKQELADLDRKRAEAEELQLKIAAQQAKDAGAAVPLDLSILDGISGGGGTQAMRTRRGAQARSPAAHLRRHLTKKLLVLPKSMTHHAAAASFGAVGHGFGMPHQAGKLGDKTTSRIEYEIDARKVGRRGSLDDLAIRGHKAGQRPGGGARRRSVQFLGGMQSTGAVQQGDSDDDFGATQYYGGSEVAANQPRVTSLWESHVQADYHGAMIRTSLPVGPSGQRRSSAPTLFGARPDHPVVGESISSRYMSEVSLQRLGHKRAARNHRPPHSRKQDPDFVWGPLLDLLGVDETASSAEPARNALGGVTGISSESLHTEGSRVAGLKNGPMSIVGVTDAVPPSYSSVVLPLPEASLLAIPSVQQSLQASKSGIDLKAMRKRNRRAARRRMRERQLRQAEHELQELEAKAALQALRHRQERERVAAIEQQALQLQQEDELASEDGAMGAQENSEAEQFGVLSSDGDFERADDFASASGPRNGELRVVSTPLERPGRHLGSVTVPQKQSISHHQVEDEQPGKANLNGAASSQPQKQHLQKIGHSRIGVGSQVLHGRMFDGLSSREGRKLHQIVSTSNIHSGQGGGSGSNVKRSMTRNLSPRSFGPMLGATANISPAEGAQVLNYLALLQRIDVMVSRRLMQLQRAQSGVAPAGSASPAGMGGQLGRSLRDLQKSRKALGLQQQGEYQGTLAAAKAEHAVQATGPATVGAPLGAHRGRRSKGLALLSSRSVAVLEAQASPLRRRQVAESRAILTQSGSLAAVRGATDHDQQKQVYQSYGISAAVTSPRDQVARPVPPSGRQPIRASRLAASQSHRQLGVGDQTTNSVRLSASASVVVVPTNLTDRPYQTSTARRATDRELAATSTAALQALSGMVGLHNLHSQKSPRVARRRTGGTAGVTAPVESKSSSRDPWGTTKTEENDDSLPLEKAVAAARDRGSGKMSKDSSHALKRPVAKGKRYVRAAQDPVLRRIGTIQLASDPLMSQLEAGSSKTRANRKSPRKLVKRRARPRKARDGVARQLALMHRQAASASKIYVGDVVEEPQHHKPGRCA